MPNTAFVREMSANDFHNCKWLAVCFFPVSVARRLRHGRCSICSVEYNSPRLRDATADERVHRFCFLLFFTAKLNNALSRTLHYVPFGEPSSMSRPRPSCELAMQRPLQPAALPTNGTTKHLR
ncbi:hypothetical protein IQ06DRAFT_78654 [Phaeosphaeriaceae sp. SRC1lsM3a]|nr:hypothetical protein IQ06DRAFT_78654 [Stagonospora sp. SRC1lsM3a]